jgi:hypothetical protein
MYLCTLGLIEVFVANLLNLNGGISSEDMDIFVLHCSRSVKLINDYIVLCKWPRNERRRGINVLPRPFARLGQRLS